MRRLLGLAVSIAALACDGGDAQRSTDAASESASSRPVAAPTFVTSAACASCHEAQHAQWRGSHHDLAMQPATAASVLGDFDDAGFGELPVRTRFFTRDGRYFVHTEGPDGVMADFEVKYTFGVEPLQQYLIELPGGRLQSLTLAWDTAQRRWFSLYPDERIAPGDPLHWTGSAQRWNSACADCHSTDLRKGYDPATGDYATTWAEIDVGCEACHGPGSSHVAWAESVAAGQSDPDGDRAMAVEFAAGSPRDEIETCAPCHSRRHRVSAEVEIGPPLLDHFVPRGLQPGLYHADGQVDGEVYVYGSFTQSAMYRRGVRCSDCHEPHGLGLRAAGNALCVRCHGESPDPRFPTLVAKAYDVPAHHFHPPDSPSAACVACHMPAKTFMGVDPRHDHSLRVPRPDLSVAYGTPNACNLCHADRSAEWAAAAVADWYGPSRRREPHFGEVLAAARAGTTAALAGLVALAGDAQQPAIARATALRALGPRAGAPAALAAIAAAARDPEALVRVAALAALDGVLPERRPPIAAPLLDDPIRAVRVEAARVLAAVPLARLEPARRAAFAAAIAEFEAAQAAQADTPGAHLNLAVVWTHRGELDRAEAAYRTALRLDRDFLPAVFNLATLYNQMRRNADAERLLRTALERFPEAGELHYSLGLVLVEEQRLGEAAEVLGRAADRLPQHARARYNHALVLQRLGRRAEAETALLRACAVDPRDPEIVHAVVIFYVQQEDWERARIYARQLVALAPGASGPQQLLDRIEAERSGVRP